MTRRKVAFVLGATAIVLGLLSLTIFVVHHNPFHHDPLRGSVIDKQFVPRHQEEQDVIEYYAPQIQVTEDCTYSNGSESCEPVTNTVMTPVWGSELVWKADSWYLRIRGLGGHRHWTQVPETVFDSHGVGSYYDSRVSTSNA